MGSTIRDVAKLAGVSRGTVSNVLNRPEIVSESTRERVLSAIKELQFVPSVPARVLAGARGPNLALVIYSVTNPFFSEIARGVEEVASKSRYVVSLLSTDADPDRERRALSVLEEHRVPGVLLTPARRRSHLADALRERGTAVVTLDREGGCDECSVSVDDRAGGLLAGRHLIERGYRDFAFLGAPHVVYQHAERYEGFRAAISEAGLSIARKLRLINVATLTISGGEAAGRLAMENRRRLPRAVLCGNDLIAIGFTRHLMASGVGIPEDVAVVGYDDIELASLVAVPITSVRQPMYDMGKRATELLISEIESSDHEHERVRFVPQLIERVTVGSAEAARSKRLATC